MLGGKTWLEALRSGEVPAILEKIASDEGLPAGDLFEAMLNGTAVVPYNSGRCIEKPCVIGAGSRVKVNANIGTSSDYAGLEDEMAKLRAAVEAGADAVMDLSTGGPIDLVRKAVIENCPVPVGSVPIYQAAVRAQEEQGSIVGMTADDMFRAIEDHCRSGVDFITVHCGVTLGVLEALRANPRVADIVSRGGAFLAGWMLHHQRENPLYAEFDRLLDIARNYEVTLSLGDGLRPGCIEDASDSAQVAELVILGELVKRCRDAGGAVHGGRPRTCSAQPGRGERANGQGYNQGSPLLCSGTAGNRCSCRLRSHRGRYRGELWPQSQAPTSFVMLRPGNTSGFRPRRMCVRV